MIKKKCLIICIFVFLFIILAILLYNLFNMFYKKTVFENDVLAFWNKNQKTIFSINKCVFFTSCNAKNKTSSNTNFTIENLYQYTDIALFINNNSEENNLENTLKSVKLTNLKYTKEPSIGSPKIYYKNINSFAKNELLTENKFENELNFEITSDDTNNLSSPTLYNNCANPIVLSYINENIKTDYTITDTSNPITYDGSLLKKCGILLNNLDSSFSFDIYITNNLDQEFKCTIFINIPTKLDDKSLYDGTITLKQNTNYIFYRYK